MMTVPLSTVGTKLFEYENDVIHMLWSLQRTDLNPVKHLWQVLDQAAISDCHHVLISPLVARE